MSFCIVAVIIALLGLYSLTAYHTEQRSKEIGVRKALGASATDVISLFTRQSILMVLISGVIATPLAIYAMQVLLRNFAYRIDISTWMILTANALVVFLTLLTISYQTLKAANIDPVKTLRYE
ncbi:FtsX-like permease family protein [candidate division KSB1 bacterium]|nr:FtsX-like permease family protein [candidate division KSB1 bacterium]